MKKLILLLCLWASVTTASAQGATYFEEYWESSGEFIAKEWHYGGNLRRESVDKMTGRNILMIYRVDSAKIYSVDMEAKTYKAIPLSMVSNMQEITNNVVGLDLETGRNTTREFVKEEVVEGYPCTLYEVKTTSTNKLSDGSVTDYYANEWVYKPYNIWIRSKELPYEPSKVRRNIQTGPQPAQLFEIPKGFEGFTLGSGGLMEMITGKSQSENQKAFEESRKSNQEKVDRINEILKITDPQQQLIEMQKLMNESKKK
jgi:hypothetical protein